MIQSSFASTIQFKDLVCADDGKIYSAKESGIKEPVLPRRDRLTY